MGSEERIGTSDGVPGPVHADLRRYLVSAVDEFVRGYPVAGIHLDFVRWYEGAASKPRTAAATMTSFVASVRTRMRSRGRTCG